MKVKTYIEAVVDLMFTKGNEKQMMKAFLFRTLIDYTPLQVAKHLKLSTNQVNNLNSARLYKVIIDNDFTAKHDICIETCREYSEYKMLCRFQENCGITRERLEKRLKLIQN